jgi:predicted AlkP superfamily phosphohydrolase/phosphomutase
MAVIKAARKVVVVGLDGLEPTLVDTMMARGLLPHLAWLRERGGYSRVATTTPAQTPVAWSTFATGMNPGGHGIFDFLKRDPATYLPDLALNRYEQKNAFTPPRAVNLRRGTAVWSLLADAGMGATVLRCPCTYPPDPLRGRLLSGMGVPDLRGGLGTATYYTLDAGVAPGESENVVRVEVDGEGRVRTHLIGPRTPKERADSRLEMTIVPEPELGRAVIKVQGSEDELIVRVGEWSDWLRVRFKLGMLQSVAGIVRFLLVELGSRFALYASPINFDPEAPLFPISSPPRFAAELAADLGPYYTTGMVEDHGGLSNGRIDEAAFLAQCREVWDEREAMMVRELERLDEGLFFCLHDTTDRVQHLFWRFLEGDHPANRGRRAGREYAGVIEEHYRRADAVVGVARDFADDDTLLVVLSDHGFGSFRRCVDLNAWLFEQGLLVLRAGQRPGSEGGDLLRGVDWEKTRAYALGLGGIYLNLKGREARGIVEAHEAEALSEAIAEGLTGLVDRERGVAAVRGVDARRRLYRGPHAADSPDLVVRFERGYRVGWGTSMGAVGISVFDDNTHVWSGDHIIDPELVTGALFMNRPFRGEGARLIDLAPTILEALGVPRGQAMEGSALLS